MPKLREAELPTDLLAGLLMEAARAPAPRSRQRERLTGRITVVMAATTSMTFATLAAGYQFLFLHTPFV